MELMDDLSRSLVAEENGASRLTGARPQLTGPARVPAQQVPWYTPEQPPRIAGPSANLPAQQVPWYTPESPPQLAAPAESPARGPIARAAGMGGRLAGGATALLAGGAAATEAAAGTVAANPDYFKTSIGDDGLAANIMAAGQAPQRIADVAREQPTTARSQNGALNVPVIAQMAAGNSTAGAGRGSVNPPSAIADVARSVTAPQYDDTYRAANLTNNLNQAYREGDPIGQIIAQKLGQQDGAQQAAPRYLAAQTGGIIGGGDTTYAPGQAARTEPYKTADGRTIDPNDANLSAADSAMIAQHRTANAQTLAAMEQAQRTNPLAGAVQIIRPGNDVSYAVQAPNRMVEIDAPAYAAYQGAMDKNPQLASRMQMTERGMTLGGDLAPPDVIGGGDAAVQKYAQALQQNNVNQADPLAAKTASEVAIKQAENQGRIEAARIAAQGHIDAAKVTNGPGDADRPATAPVLGVPVPTVAPWSGQGSKDAAKIMAAQIASGGKEVEKDGDAARAAALAAQRAKQFIALNEKVSTGGPMDRIGVTRSLQGMGTDYGTMESLTAKLAPSERIPGSGATSDFDAKQFERATVGVDKPLETNKKIANAIVAQAQQAQDYANFRQTYLEQNRTLQGADRYWKEYADKNPIFDPKKEGSFDLNPGRKDWREHFAPKSDAPAGGQGSAAKPTVSIGQVVDGHVYKGGDPRQQSSWEAAK